MAKCHKTNEERSAFSTRKYRSFDNEGAKRGKGNAFSAVDLRQFLDDNPNLRHLPMFQEMLSQRTQIAADHRGGFDHDRILSNSRQSSPPKHSNRHYAGKSDDANHSSRPETSQEPAHLIRRHPSGGMNASNRFETQPPFEEENFPDISEPFAINPNTDFDWESAKTGEASGIDNKIFIDPDSPIENQGTNRDIPLPFPTVAASNLPVSMLPRNSLAVASGVKNMVTSDYGNDIDVASTAMLPISTTLENNDQAFPFKIADYDENDLSTSHQASHQITSVVPDPPVTGEKSIERTTMATTTNSHAQQKAAMLFPPANIDAEQPTRNSWQDVIDINNHNLLEPEGDGLRQPETMDNKLKMIDVQQLLEDSKLDKQFDGGKFELFDDSEKAMELPNSMRESDSNVSEQASAAVPDLFENTISRAIPVHGRTNGRPKTETTTAAAPPPDHTPYYTKQLLAYRDLYHRESSTTISPPAAPTTPEATATTMHPAMKASAHLRARGSRRRLIVGGIRTHRDRTMNKAKLRGNKRFPDWKKPETVYQRSKFGNRSKLSKFNYATSSGSHLRKATNKTTKLPGQRVFVTNPALFGHDFLANPGVFFNGSLRPVQRPILNVREMPRRKPGRLVAGMAHPETTTVACCDEHVHSGGKDMQDFQSTLNNRQISGIRTKSTKLKSRRRPKIESDKEIYALAKAVAINGITGGHSTIEKLDPRRRSSLFDCFKQERNCILVNELPIERRIGMTELECLQFCTGIPYCASICYAQHLSICDVYNVKNGTNDAKLVKLSGYVYYEPRSTRLEFCSEPAFLSKNLHTKKQAKLKSKTSKVEPSSLLLQAFEPPMTSNSIANEGPDNQRLRDPSQLLSKGECPDGTDIVFHRLNGWRLPHVGSDVGWRTDEENCVFSCLINMDGGSSNYACSSATYDFVTDVCTISSQTTVFAGRKEKRALVPNGNSIYYEKSCISADLAVQCSGRHIERHPQMLLLESARAVKTVQSLHECTSMCFGMQSFRCMSLVYFLDESSYNCIMNNESRVTQPLLFVEEFESRVEYVGLDDCMAPADTVPSAAPRSQDVQKLKQRNWSVVAKRRHANLIKQREGLEDLQSLKGKAVALDGGNVRGEKTNQDRKKMSKKTKSTKSLLTSIRQLPRQRKTRGKMNFGRRYSALAKSKQARRRVYKRRRTNRS